MHGNRLQPRIGLERGKGRCPWQGFGHAGFGVQARDAVVLFKGYIERTCRSFRQPFGVGVKTAQDAAIRKSQRDLFQHLNARDLALSTDQRDLCQIALVGDHGRAGAIRA